MKTEEEQEHEETYKEWVIKGNNRTSDSTLDLLEKNSDGDILCKYCKRPFVSQKWLSKHLQVIHSELQCEDCNFTTLNLEEMNVHSKTGHKNYQKDQTKALEKQHQYWTEKKKTFTENEIQNDPLSYIKVPEVSLGGIDRILQKSQIRTDYNTVLTPDGKSELIHICQMPFGSERWLKRHLEIKFIKFRAKMCNL